MKIEFTSADIREYSHGNFVVVNTNSPFDIADISGPAFLAARHPVPNAKGDLELVPVFKEFKEGPPTTADLFATYPAEFPGAAELSAAGLSFLATAEASDEKLTKVKGIGKKGLAAIRDWRPPLTPAEEFADGHDRDALIDMAKALDLDGNKYTDKVEMATAILAAQAKAEETN